MHPFWLSFTVFLLLNYSTMFLKVKAAPTFMSHGGLHFIGRKLYDLKLTKYVKYYNEYLISMMKKKLKEKELEELLAMQNDREKNIYNKHLANRINSSFKNDFITMRY